MIREVVVGIDFSPESRRAMRVGCECAERLHVPLRAIHVLPDPLPSGGEIPVPLDPRRKAAEERDAGAKLEGWLEAFPEAHGEVLRGSCGTALAAAAAADSLLIVARHDHATLRHLLFGSTSGHLLRHAHCPVLLVPAEPSA